MCKDLKAGPACVSACPTGAAIRIHAEDVPILARKRAARA
jgi:Fe-S-cluster-containing hydrogenase component 2